MQRHFCGRLGDDFSGSQEERSADIRGDRPSLLCTLADVGLSVISIRTGRMELLCQFQDRARMNHSASSSCEHSLHIRPDHADISSVLDQFHPKNYTFLSLYYTPSHYTYSFSTNTSGGPSPFPAFANRSCPGSPFRYVTGSIYLTLTILTLPDSTVIVVIVCVLAVPFVVAGVVIADELLDALADVLGAAAPLLLCPCENRAKSRCPPP